MTIKAYLKNPKILLNNPIFLTIFALACILIFFLFSASPFQFQPLSFLARNEPNSFVIVSGQSSDNSTYFKIPKAAQVSLASVIVESQEWQPSSISKREGLPDSFEYVSKVYDFDYNRMFDCDSGTYTSSGTLAESVRFCYNFPYNLVSLRVRYSGASDKNFNQVVNSSSVMGTDVVCFYLTHNLKYVTPFIIEGNQSSLTLYDDYQKGNAFYEFWLEDVIFESQKAYNGNFHIGTQSILNQDLTNPITLDIASAISSSLEGCIADAEGMCTIHLGFDLPVPGQIKFHSLNVNYIIPVNNEGSGKDVVSPDFELIQYGVRELYSASFPASPSNTWLRVSKSAENVFTWLNQNVFSMILGWFNVQA